MRQFSDAYAILHAILDELPLSHRGPPMLMARISPTLAARRQPNVNLVLRMARDIRRPKKQII